MGGCCGVSANKYSCAHHVTWSPNKLWRSTSHKNLFKNIIYLHINIGENLVADKALDAVVLRIQLLVILLVL